MNFTKCLVVFNLLLFGFSSLASIEINGYYENDLVGGIEKDGASFWGDLNRLRLRIDIKLLKMSVYILSRNMMYYLSRKTSL